MVFSINTIFLSLMGLFIGYNVLNYYLTTKDIYQPPIGALPAPIEVGKSKVYVSKDRDASMATEIKRRRAIIGSNSCAVSPKFGYKDSTNGSLETFFISGLCPKFVKDSVLNLNSIESVISAITGGSVGNSTDTQNAPVLDGGGSNTDSKTSIFANPGGSNTDYTSATTIDFGGAK